MQLRHHYFVTGSIIFSWPEQWTNATDFIGGVCKRSVKLYNAWTWTYLVCMLPEHFQEKLQKSDASWKRNCRIDVGCHLMSKNENQSRSNKQYFIFDITFLSVILDVSQVQSPNHKVLLNSQVHVLCLSYDVIKWYYATKYRSYTRVKSYFRGHNSRLA